MELNLHFCIRFYCVVLTYRVLHFVYDGRCELLKKQSRAVDEAWLGVGLAVPLGKNLA